MLVGVFCDFLHGKEQAGVMPGEAGPGNAPSQRREVLAAGLRGGVRD